MPEAKQPHLNGAYYGPSIPPPQQKKSYHRPGRGGAGCCCGCLCSCIFNLIFQIILAVVVVVGVAALIIWLVLRPNKVKFHVTEATLTQFDLSTTNNTLYYDLALNMTIRNPNKRVGIYYDRIEARASYEGERFGSIQLTPFYQGHKRTDYLSPVFKGQHVGSLGGSDLSKLNSEYNREKVSGIYSIDLKLRLRVRFKVGVVKTPRFKPNIECDLKVPLNSNGRASPGTFQTTSCGLDW